MFSITHSAIFVLDQDEALDFYVGKLGMEVNTDVDLGFMRWLTINAPGDPSREVLLELPGPPAHDDATAQQVREMVTKGATGFALGLRTDDCLKTYEELKAKGVEFTSEPTEQSYGLDFGLRDPFGNNIRIVQPATAPVVP
jgi:catechol 2,3-dioxygenase-like lactoylglutathione lyase family enzyme